MAKTTNPKGVNQQEDLDIKKRATIYLSVGKIKQIKYLAYHEEITQTEIIDTALDEFIKKWEQKNGPIPKK